MYPYEQHRKQKSHHQILCRKWFQDLEIVLALQYPILLSEPKNMFKEIYPDLESYGLVFHFDLFTQKISLKSVRRKIEALTPMVDLVANENLFSTYRSSKEVLPTLMSN